jgi:N6-adenosine-specific RNA methylase IME4
MENKDSNISGYRIYNPEQKRRTQTNNLPNLYPDLPKEKYDIIYADPPWDYGGKTQFDKSSQMDVNKNWEKDIFMSAANFKYPTLKTKEMMKIPIQDIANDDCLLFMWVTNPHLEQGIKLGNAWGFEYKTVAFVWDKMNHNPGQYTLSYCELCLVFKRGRIPSPRGARNIKQLVRAPRGKHSEKPIEILHNIEKMFPTQKRIELFARHKPKGWDVWGLDVPESKEG